MVARIQRMVEGWTYDVVSLDYPGPVLRNRPVAEPYNLGRGSVGFDFETAFGHPVKVVNDAAMQDVLELPRRKSAVPAGLATGLENGDDRERHNRAYELGHLPYKKRTYEDYVGRRGLERTRKRKWRRDVEDVVARLVAALEPDDVVLGGET